MKYVVLFLISFLIVPACSKETNTPDTIPPDDPKDPIEMPLSYDQENPAADCIVPPFPSVSELPVIESLPDPFLWNYAIGRVRDYEGWLCRRNEIGELLQHYELGRKPEPPSDIQADFNGSQLNVTVMVDGNSLTLTSTISLPQGEGPHPAVIGIGLFGHTGSLPSDLFTSRQIATVQFNDGQIAPQWTQRGQGAFYQLYPDTRVGAFAAWAWGVSRIIDGLYMTADETNIDLSKLAITGCSYAGKIALFSAALDARIALTIAQEPGGGGDAAWRVTETLDGERETLRNAQGAAWYHEDFKQFNNSVTKLPFDHHQVMAMIAPRALFLLGNPDYEWLAEESGHVSCAAASRVWNALGVPERFGFSKMGGHGHCQLPNIQRPEVGAFVDRFLLGKESADTDIRVSPFDPDLNPWITWGVPDLN